jgi:hypothetical protein
MTSSLHALGLLDEAIRRSHLVHKAALIASAPACP